MENPDYKLLEDIKDKQFKFIIGGRYVGKIDFFAKYLCCHLEYYLGGKASYSSYKDYIEITVHNDDIGCMKYTLYNDTIIYEKGYVIFTRMLEEYDAYMKYKYRDYKERGEEE